MDHTLMFRSFSPDSPVHIRTTFLTSPSWSAEHGHDFWEFTIVKRGSLRQRLNGREILLPTSAVLMNGPGDVHALRGEGRGALFVNVAFPRSAMDEVLTFMPAPPSRADRRAPLMVNRLPRPHLVSIEETLKVLDNEEPMSWNQKVLCVKQMVVTVLYCLRLQEHRADAALGRDERPRWLAEAMEAMRSPANFSPGLRRFLTLAGVSQEHLTRSMRRWCRTTPTGFINGLRLAEAARLLRETDQPVLSIMLDCGFNNMSHFCERFKARYGCSPREYRRNNEMVVGRV